VSFFARNLQIFKRIGLPLYVLTLVYSSLDQLLTINTEAALYNPEGSTSWVWAYGFVSLLIGILFPILGSLVVIYGAQSPNANEKGLWEYVLDHLNQMGIEVLRSWGMTLLWSLIFILPGLWKYIEYTMIPFVVTRSRRYDRGEQDALCASTQIVRQNLFRVLGVLLVFHLVVPSILTVFFDDFRLIWRTPVSAALLTLLDVYLFIFSTQLLLEIFERQNSEVPDDALAHV